MISDGGSDPGMLYNNQNHLFWFTNQTYLTNGATWKLLRNKVGSIDASDAIRTLELNELPKFAMGGLGYITTKSITLQIFGTIQFVPIFFSRS